MHANRTAPRRQFTAGILITALTATLALSACGSRRDAQEFVAANTGTGVVADAGTGVATDGGLGTVPAPGAVPAPGTVAGATDGATSPDAVASPGAAKPGASGTNSSGTAAKGTKTAATGNKCATSGSVLILGNISTQSGLLGELFKGLPEALQVWAKAANACGGVGGHPVRVLSADDGGDPATALTIAQRMVQNDKVLAFIGLDMPLSVAGIERYLKEVGVPSIGGDSSELPFFTNPMFFPIGPFVSVIGAADAEIAIARGAKKLAVFYCTEIPNSCGPVAASKDLQVGSPVVKAMGGEVVLSQKASVVAPSYTSQCIAAKRAGAEAIIAILDGPSVGRLATNCHAQDYKPLFLGISLGLSGNLTDYPALNEDNFFAPLNTFPWVDTSLPATKKYTDDVQKYFGRALSGPSPAMAYASGELLAAAARAGLPASPTSADIVKAMYTVKNETLGGLVAPLTFTPKLPREGITSCYFLVAISKGKYTAPEGSKCLKVNARGPQ
ncbi:ABC transporter substrate-binding protein [Sporichthya polymorpha]|uniref:ABC transporter substrate-binding protein n=1 Tax=Sporichthya polymorpha TaxID=35751 RepID=UPI000377237D|nr:ABC transporter substrate-binding protein [Sporichthya polymorpha]